MDWKGRTKLLVDQIGIDRLHESRVMIVGVGGVGGFVAEFLARAGVGNLILVDGDDVQPSNRNRQIQALIQTENRMKATVLQERIAGINPEAKVETITEFIGEENMETLFQFAPLDYVVDAIDTLSPKVHLIRSCLERKIPIVSSLGSAGRWDPTKIQIADISKTHGCPLGRHVRKRLKDMGIVKGFQAVFSPEPVDRSRILREKSPGKASTMGTISYMPPAFGTVIASVVIRALLEKEG